MKTLVWLLRAYLHLGVEGEEGEGETPPPADGTASAADTGDDTLDDLLDQVEPPREGATAPDPKEELAAERARAKALQAELDAERAARRSAPAEPATPTRDPEFEREEEQLRQARASGADESTVRWLQWQIDSNRKIRATERNSNAALAQAQDIADRASFERLEVTKPKVFKRYAERVEKAIADMRAKGQSAPRMAVLRLMIGDDIMNDTLKPRGGKAAPAATQTTSTVDRGRTPGARSDTTARKGAQTEREKRIARLENRLI